MTFAEEIQSAQNIDGARSWHTNPTGVTQQRLCQWGASYRGGSAKRAPFQDAPSVVLVVLEQIELYVTRYVQLVLGSVVF